MNAKTTRILKEVRSLFWPWCAVVIVCALPLVHTFHSIDWVAMAFFVGVPLLATLSLGNEFQHRTISLLLSQPINRTEIWGEKLSVTMIAVLSAALVFCYGVRFELRQDPKLWVFGSVFVIALVASATFWTLFARSTMGGLALNGLALDLFLLSFVILGRLLGHSTAKNWDEVFGPNPSSTRSIATLCYAGVMLWLGWRKLVRYQVTGGMAGDDLLMAGPNVMPEALGRWFRCRPTGALLNLIRKELRLLRPLWLISLLASLGWGSLIMFGLVPERGSTKDFPAAGVMLLVSTLLIAILAGSLSLGEERTSGTHSWHMTLPVSALRQWLVKLLMALFAGFVGVVLLPVSVLIAGGFLFGSPFKFLDVRTGMIWLQIVLLLSFASFWCACAVNGTVRAALWVFPALGALALAGELGDSVVEPLMTSVLSKFDFFSDFQFTNSVSNFLFFDNEVTPVLVVALFLVPILLVAVIQSYRLFRTQARDGISSILRSLWPLATMAFLFSFSVTASFTFIIQAKQHMGEFFTETHKAIENVLPGTPILDAAHPLELTAEDLAKASPLSERARRWLRNSRIRVAPEKPHPGPCCHPGIAWGMYFASDKPWSGYSVTIQMARGPDCTLSFHAGRNAGIVRGVCE